MVTRTVIAAIFIGVLPLLAACSGGPERVVEATPTMSDEDQIRGVITELAAAQGDSDTAKIAELTCAKYRDQASSGAAGFDDMPVPPMNALPLDVLAKIPPEQLAENLGKEYAGASEESVRALADALIRRDEAAYTTAMADVMAQSLTLSVAKLENVTVSGDTATADATLALSMGGKMSYTVSDGQLSLVREDGRWKDCTPPSE